MVSEDRESGSADELVPLTRSRGGRRVSSDPTGHELRILRFIWERGSVTVEDVQKELAPEKELAYTTVQTTLNRMAIKGQLSREKHGRAFRYTTIAEKSVTQRSLLQSLIARVFGGSARALVMDLIKGGDLSADELKDLEATMRNRNAPDKARWPEPPPRNPRGR